MSLLRLAANWEQLAAIQMLSMKGLVGSNYWRTQKGLMDSSLETENAPYTNRIGFEYVYNIYFSWGAK